MTEQRLEVIDGLARADEPREDAQDSALGAQGDEPGRGRLSVETAVARPLPGIEHAGLSFEAEDRAVDVWLLEQHRGIVHEVPRREIVGPVDDDIVVP